MSSGDTARPAPDVEGLLRAWLQTQERGLHLLRADDFQGVSDGHLVEARLQKCKKARAREITPPAPPRERRGAAVRSNRFVRGASSGTARVRLEIARRRREATLGEQLHKIGPRACGAAPAARPAWPEARESPSSITGASAKNTEPQRHLVRMHSCTSVTEQLDLAICQDAAPARPDAAWPAGATFRFPLPLSRKSPASPSSLSRAQAAIARRRREASRLCEELYKKNDQTRWTRSPMEQVQGYSSRVWGSCRAVETVRDTKGGV